MTEQNNTGVKAPSDKVSPEGKNVNTSTEVPGGSPSVGFPPFATETYAGQLVWLALCFGALYVLIAKVVEPRLGGIIEMRKAKIAADLKDAGDAKLKAENANIEYDRALKEAKTKAQIMAQANQEKLTADADALRKKLEAELSSKIDDAEAAILSKKNEAMAHVRAIAIETSAVIVEKLTGRAPAANTVVDAVDRAAA